MHTTCLSFVVSAGLLGAVAAGYAGVEIRIRESTFQGDSPTISSSVMRMDGPNIAYEPGRGSASPLGVIFQGQSSRLLNLDHTRRSFTVLDDAVLKQMGEAMQRALKLMEKYGQGGAVPPDRQAPLGTLKPTEESREIAGLPCRLYDLMLGDRKAMEIWVTDWDRVGLRPADIEGMYLMEDFQKRLQQSMPRSRAHADREQPIIGLRRLGGFPVMYRHVYQGRVIREVAHTQVIKVDFPPAVFAPPPTYMEKIIVLPGMQKQP